MKRLDGYLAIVPDVMGQVHGTHPALAKYLEQFVLVSQGLAQDIGQLEGRLDRIRTGELRKRAEEVVGLPIGLEQQGHLRGECRISLRKKL